MPTYLIHGFRWPRQSIRVHVILNKIDDASPDWIIGPATPMALLNTFYTKWEFLPGIDSTPETSPSPSRLLKNGTTSSASAAKKGKERASSVVTGSESSGIEGQIGAFNDWSLIKFMEQYEIKEDGRQNICQPHAYVGDYIVQIPLSCDITKEIETYDQRKTEELLSLSAAASGLNTPTSTGRSGSRSPATSPTSPPDEVAVPDTGERDDVIANLEHTGAGIRKMSSRDFRRRKKRIGWLEKLREELEKETWIPQGEIGWFVVVCEDEERSVDGLVLEDDVKSSTVADNEKGESVEHDGDSEGNVRGGDGVNIAEVPHTLPKSPFGSVKKFFRRRSEKSLKGCSVSAKFK